MTEDKRAQERNVGPEPVQAEPNQVREKTYEPSNPPPQAAAATEALPEKTAEGKVETDMSEAVETVKKRI